MEDAPAAAMVQASPTAPALTGREAQLDRIRELEDRMLAQSLELMDDVINFADIDPATDVAPPQSWIDELGADRAWKRFRHMQAAWMNSKQAPVAVGITASFAAKVIKARSVEKQAPRPIGIVLMLREEPEKLEIIDVESD